MTDQNLVSVFTADSRRPVDDAGLVLSAVGVRHVVTQADYQWHLLVEPEQQAFAHMQLKDYWAENQPNPIKAVEPVVVDSGWYGVIGYLFIIWLIPATQGSFENELRELGLLQAGLVMEGEWWRAVTALTLHSDFSHIASNSLFGTLFGLFVGRYLGSGLGWLLVLLCGFVANLANALVQPSGFRALGASTATFAALGLIPAFGWRRGYFKGRGFKRGFAPIFAAIAILAYTGFGAENVDAIGHIFGFLCGIGLGLLIAHIDLHAISKADQQRAGTCAVILVGAAWYFAI